MNDDSRYSGLMFIIATSLYVIAIICLMSLNGCATTEKRGPTEYKCKTIDHGTWAEFKCRKVLPPQ